MLRLFWILKQKDFCFMNYTRQNNFVPSDITTHQAISYGKFEFRTLGESKIECIQSCPDLFTLHFCTNQRNYCCGKAVLARAADLHSTQC